MTSSLITLVSAAAPAERTRELPLPPIVFGLIAFGCFLTLLAVLWSFRNTARAANLPERGPDEDR